jgi:hypothetical protein
MIMYGKFKRLVVEALLESIHALTWKHLKLCFIKYAVSIRFKWFITVKQTVCYKMEKIANESFK